MVARAQLLRPLDVSRVPPAPVVVAPFERIEVFLFKNKSVSLQVFVLIK